MKLTKKFWVWVGQVFAANILLWRVELLRELFAPIPNVDVSQFNLEIDVVKLGVFLWLAWLVWRAYQGFYRTMDFLIDENDHRY